MADRLTTDQQLKMNEELISGNGVVRLIMQGDGNLVEYETDNNRPLWASNTVGSGATYAIMQGDGNFVLYNDSNSPKWASGTYRNPGSYVVLQDDGNLVIYNPQNAPVWANNVQFYPNGKRIPPQRAKWEQDYYQITSVDYYPDERLAVVEQSLTNTFKISGFTSGARLLFYGADNQLIGSADHQVSCPQAPLFGAAHEDQHWTATAPEGTQGIGLLQYFRPSLLDELGNLAEDFFTSIAAVIADGAEAINQWCDQNPGLCAAIGFTLFIIGGTALCLSAPESCEVVISIGLALKP